MAQLVAVLTRNTQSARLTRNTQSVMSLSPIKGSRSYL
mgnify:CR=1 FL=1